MWALVLLGQRPESPSLEQTRHFPYLILSHSALVREWFIYFSLSPFRLVRASLRPLNLWMIEKNIKGSVQRESEGEISPGEGWDGWGLN